MPIITERRAYPAASLFTVRLACQYDGMVDPRAGQPAAAEDLVDVAKLVTAYYTVHPDPGDATQRVSFGTSGHRGSAFTATFNEDHILATTQAICEYRAAHRAHGTPGLR